MSNFLKFALFIILEQVILGITCIVEHLQIHYS